MRTSNFLYAIKYKHNRQSSSKLMNIVSISKEKISGVANSFLSKNEYIIINYIL